MGCVQLVRVRLMASMRNTRMPARNAANTGGHGTSYAVLPDAMICAMDSATFSWSVGRKFRMAKTTPATAAPRG